MHDIPHRKYLVLKWFYIATPKNRTPFNIARFDFLYWSVLITIKNKTNFTMSIPIVGLDIDHTETAHINLNSISINPVIAWLKFRIVNTTAYYFALVLSCIINNVVDGINKTAGWLSFLNFWNWSTLHGYLVVVCVELLKYTNRQRKLEINKVLKKESGHTWDHVKQQWNGMIGKED